MPNSKLITELKTLVERSRVDYKVACKPFDRAIQCAVSDTLTACLGQVKYLSSLIPSESDGGTRADKPHGNSSEVDHGN